MKSRVPGVGDSGAYTDLNRLNQLKTGKDRDSEANVRKVAQEFESLFVNEMFKAMRSANQALTGDSFLNTETTKHYQQMHDQQLAVTLSREGGGIGLADVLVRQMTERKGSHRPNPFATPDQAVLGQVATPLNGAVTETETVRDDRAALRARRLTHLPVAVSTRHEVQPDAAPQTGKPLVDLGWQPASGKVLPERFDSPAQFAAALLPMAENAARRLGVDPRYLVAQAALETGWGGSIIQGEAGSSHNLFGIKAQRGWQGPSAEVLTTEYYNGQPTKEAARFRAYDSFAQSFEDYADFLQGNGRYQEALKSADNPDKFMSELQKAGYATDPQYASKVNQIARQLQTYQMVAAAGSNKNS
jgi:flagellar protein FlgJ